MKKLILLTLLFHFSVKNIYAQAGKPDLSFGGKGHITEDFIKINSYYERISQLFPTTNTSYIAVITGLNGGPNALARYFSDGTLDESFAKKGYLFAYVNITRVAQQADGKILVAGESGQNAFNLVRYNSDGTTDTTFGSDGKIPNDFYIDLLNIQNDGRIVAAAKGTFPIRINRYNSNGSPDSTFDHDGKLTESHFSETVLLNSVQTQNDGKIIIAGTIVIPIGDRDETFKYVLIRYKSDGSVDEDFGENGRVIPEFSYIGNEGILVTLNGAKVVIASTVHSGSDYDIALAQYNPDGTPDPTFNIGGVQPADLGGDNYPVAITIQNDGKFIVLVYAGDFAIARYNVNGSLDSSFDNDGKLTTDFGFGDLAYTMILQSNGKILVGGETKTTPNYDFAIARYDNDGSLDNTFFGTGKKIGFFPGASRGALYSIAVQSDGKIVVGGNVIDTVNRDNFFISRYKPDGTPDKTFGDQGKQVIDFKYESSQLNALGIQHDGKIVVAGNVFENDGAISCIARCNPDGTPDSTFNGTGIQITDFGPNYLFTSIRSIAFQKDGKIIAAGDATDLSFDEGSIIARYNQDGSLDSSFSGDGKLTNDFGYIVSTAIQNDGKIVSVGSSGITRYNSDGTPDIDFSEDGRQTTHIIAQSVDLQNDGKILVGGRVFSQNGSEVYFAVARYNNDASPDSTFNQTGELTGRFGTYSSVNAVKAQNNGKIILLGQGGIAIARLNSDGSFDSTFGTFGKVIYDFGGGEVGAAGAIFNSKLYVTGNRTVAAFDLAGKNNIPPTVSLTTPANNATYLSGGSVYLTAVASDADGTISKVEFYNGTTLLYTAIDTPYTFKWQHVLKGDYILTAKATDNDGLVTTSDTVHISVVPNKPPTVSVINPANGKIFLKGATVHLQAAAADADGRVGKVEFYNGATLLATEHKLPYTFDWTIGKSGNYTITAKATDNWGAVTTSAAINISVVPNTSPTVNIISPSNGQVFIAPATINLKASAQDPDGRIVQVSFYNGATLLTNSEHKVPYTYSWQNVPAGIYNITAVAKDNWSAQTTSAPLTVTVIMPTAKSPISPRPISAVTKAGINDSGSIIIAPNPARNIVTIYTAGLQRSKQSTISVISSSGIILQTKHSDGYRMDSYRMDDYRMNNSMAIGFAQTIQLNVSSLASGIYTIRFVNGDVVMYRKFLKL